MNKILAFLILTLILSTESFAQLTISSISPNNVYTSCNSNSFVGCSNTYSGRLVWRSVTTTGTTISFNIVKYNSTCTGSTNVLAAGTAFIKDNDACGAILATQAYSVNPGIINMSYTFPTAGTFTLVAVCTTSTAKFYTEPIIVTVTAPTPVAPILNSPSNFSCVDYTLPVTFSWNASANATSYEFELIDVASSSLVIPITFPSSATSFTMNNNYALWQPNKKYRWTVQACNANNACVYSPVNEFYTSPTIQQATCNSPVPIGNTANFYSNNTDAGVTYSWAGPTSLGNISNPNITNAQSSSSGTYSVTVNNSFGCSYTSTTALTVGSTVTGVTVLNPNGGQTFNAGSNATIQWTSNNISGNVQIELVNTSNTVVATPSTTYSLSTSPNSIAGPGGIVATTNSITWPINTTIPAGQYKIKLYSITNTSYIDYSDNYFTITNTPVVNCISWNTQPTIPAQIDQEAYDAMQYLCAKNIINTSQSNLDIDNKLHRDELAKITFKALFSPNGAGVPYVNVTTPADDFPVPYYDMQPPFTTYEKEAKAMCYLQYNDCVTPFDRDFTHFRPSDSIVKRYALKELLEAFNIAPAASNTPFPWPAGTYTDVNTGIDGYEYIIKAYQLGIIGQSSVTFGFAQPLTRRNAFRYLYKLLQLYDANSPLIGGGNKPAPTPADYYYPFNQKVGNMNSLLGIDQGAFNSYTKTSFGIAGKMPLVFAHSYNSANTSFPSAFNVLQPMGKGWNHNYNCYIKKFDDGYGNNIRYTIFWGDGTLISFSNPSANVFTPLEQGVYSTLANSNGGNTFTYTTKSKVVYKFDRQTNLNAETWCITKITDRNNNYLNIGWQVVTAKYAQVNQVSDPQYRQLNFTYTNYKLTKLQCLTGSITRYVDFTYNTMGDLETYKDPMAHNTTYIYFANPTPCEEHLLKQIQLPKGNIIDNTYDKRKLASSAFAGQYLTNVIPQTHYVNGNNIDYTSATISTTQAGQTIVTNVKQNELGNTVHIDDAASNLDIGYNNAGQPNKPTSFTNTTNNITATTSYDAMGNVLSVTKTAPSMPTITESFTYNSFNDVNTYNNANGNQTTFNYNGTGNLISILDALGNTTNITPNADGTVQKVTNPSGFYTDYQYDAYGNTTQSKLQNTITSNATYDDASRLTEANNPNNIKTKYDYNNNDQVTSMIYDYGNINNSMFYDYDANGNLKTITNPKGDNTILSYNLQDQLIQYNFLGLTKNYTYNQNGTLNTFTNQNGTLFNHSYNADGMLTADGYASYAYTPTTKNLSTITSNVNNSVITFGYDNYQRVNNINYNYTSGSNSVTYEYDNTNNIKKITYPNGFAVAYDYDALSRLYQVKNYPSNAVYATYSYHADGRLQQCVNGNGTKTIYQYDAMGRLDSISNQTSTNAIISAYKFTLDNLGNHIAEASNEPFAPLMPNLISGTTTYSHTATNRMTAQGATSTSFYNSGNENANTGTLNATYTWDDKDNLLTSTSPVLNCDYDGAENRRKRNNTRFVLDLLGDNLLMETDLSGNPTAYYIQGLGLVCRLDAAQANPAYYHYDYRGSTTAITNAGQTVTHKYLYGAFGEQLAVAETGFTNQFRYVGKYGVMFEDSTLYYMRARYYNPNKGRFLGEDKYNSIKMARYYSKVKDYKEIEDKLPDLRNQIILFNQSFVSEIKPKLIISIYNGDNNSESGGYAYSINSPILNIDPKGTKSSFANDYLESTDRWSPDLSSKNTTSSMPCIKFVWYNPLTWFNSSANNKSCK
jgi:RHS repeat-associated protein